MADITGSTSIGYGFSLAYDVNPSTSNPTATISLKWESLTLSSATLTQTSATAKIGGSEGGVKVEASITANWSTDSITYSATFDPKIGPSSSKSGTIVHW